MDITEEVRELAQLIYPGLTPRQLSRRINKDSARHYLRQLRDRDTTPGPGHDHHDPGDPAGLCWACDEPGPPIEPASTTADRIETCTPAIDDTNWALLHRNITDAINTGTWNPDTEQRLIQTLTEPFDGARNERRVQNSRISHFFYRLHRTQ